MIIYKVIIHIQKQIEQEWLSWIKEQHIPEIMDLKLFNKVKIFKILNNENLNLESYCVAYHCESIEEYNQYQKKFSEKIQKKHAEKYKGKFTAERLILSLKNEF